MSLTLDDHGEYILPNSRRCEDCYLEDVGTEFHIWNSGNRTVSVNLKQAWQLHPGVENELQAIQSYFVELLELKYEETLTNVLND